MTVARLVIDASTMSFRASGPATGNVALMLGDVVFPAPCWNDFIVVIIEAWVSALARLLCKRSERERVYFMEGPYAVDLVALADGRLRLHAVERPNRERACADILPLEFVKSVLSSAETVLQACKNANYTSMDTERLEAGMPHLQREASRLSD